MLFVCGMTVAGNRARGDHQNRRLGWRIEFRLDEHWELRHDAKGPFTLRQAQFEMRPVEPGRIGPNVTKSCFYAIGAFAWDQKLAVGQYSAPEEPLSSSSHTGATDQNKLSLTCEGLMRCERSAKESGAYDVRCSPCDKSFPRTLAEFTPESAIFCRTASVVSSMRVLGLWNLRVAVAAMRQSA